MRFRELELKRNPFLKISSILILCLVLLGQFYVATNTLFISAFLSISLFTYLYYYNRTKSAFIFGIITISLLLQIRVNQYNFNLQDRFYPQGKALIKGYVAKTLNTNSKGSSVLVKADLRTKIIDKENISLNLFVYGNEKLIPGDKIIANVFFNPPHPRQIHEDFPDRSFSISKKVHFKGFVNAKDIQFISH